MTNEQLVNAAKTAILKVFNDRQISQQKCKESLMELRDEIDILIDTLE